MLTLDKPKSADFILLHKRLSEDKILYWDFDAPEIPDALRDASAVSIICSALMRMKNLIRGVQ